MLKIFGSVLCMALLCVGCTNVDSLKNTVELQQQSINEMQARLKKLEMQVGENQQQMNEIKKEYTKVGEDIKKVQPKYVEGMIQEGGN